MFGIGQANEGNIFILPKTLKLLRVIWPDCQNDCAAFSELCRRSDVMPSCEGITVGWIMNIA